MKIRIKNSCKVSFDNLVMFVALFSISSFALLEHVSVPISAFSAVKLPLLYVGGICLLTRINLFLENYKKVRYFYMLATLAALCVLLMLSVYNNRNPVIGTNPMRSTIRLILYLVELFLLAIWISERGKCKYAINFLFWYVLILVVATDFLLFTRLIVFTSGRFEYYLIGTKFTVSYMHMNLLTLWFIRNNLRLYKEGRFKWFVMLAVPFILAVSWRIDCMTGVVGCMLLGYWFLTMNTHIQKRTVPFHSPIVLWCFLIASVLFPFLAERITAIPLLAQILEDLLGRDTTLTGRLAIFGTFGAKMSGHWMWGYGYGNANTAAMRLFHYANAQNAQLNWILHAGLPVTIAIDILMTIIIRQLERSPRKRQIMPLVILVYVYIILGMIETTFGMSFMLWLACIFMQVNEKKQV